MSTPGTEILFMNHSSLLIKYINREAQTHYLLLDPWHTKPAFGSWLPNFHQYISPTYLAALGDKLTILISHAHDDHCDDQLLSLFDKETKIITAKFDSGSVKRRISKLGFTNVIECSEDGVQVESLHIKSFINREVSFDDALYSISFLDSLVIHANDNWFQINEKVQKILEIEIQKVGKSKTFFFTQTNSASGFPLTYPQFESKRDGMLLSKISKMIRSGMKNASILGLEKIYSYAGFANIYIKNESYESLFTTSKFINKVVIPFLEGLADTPKNLMSEVRVEELYPGDVIMAKDERVQKAFVSSDDYSDANILEKSKLYYQNYNLLDSCDTWKYTTGLVAKPHLEYFLNGMQEFAEQLIERESTFKSLVGKSLEIHCRTSGIRSRVVFAGDSDLENPPNKLLEVEDALMCAVLNGEVLFENLYTGYQGKWFRYPKEVYNRDIVLILVMYSYKYKNLLSKNYLTTK